MKQRLLDLIKPHSYKLHINLADSLDSFSTEGSLSAELKKPSNLITLHAKDLTFDYLDVEDHDGSIYKSFKHNKQNQTVTILLQRELATGNQIVVHFKVSAPITSTMHGIYPAHYEEGSQRKTIISTQFESHHAREVFPCIDEPAAKATFELSVTSNKDHEIVSNTSEVNTTYNKEQKTVHFARSPKMSTYLLAFASGGFGSITGKTKRGVTTNIYATQQNTNKLDFALDVAVRCLDFYEDYFGIEYPLEKCDHIAIPEFASGAMENWGCITYRETALLVDPEQTSISSKQWVALVIAHEIAHQWFGNLVTMQWWDDLWLNEGFASWIEFKAVDALFPEWNIWEQFVTTDYASALSMDALASSHPIRVRIDDPREINEVFDTITYRKGCSIIRMLNDHLGDTVFQEGLQQYLNSHLYDNATTDDLWSSLSKSAKQDVGEFMHTWTSEIGYPIVTVKDQSETLKLEQQRFTVHPEANHVDYLWHIPLFDANNTVLTKKSVTIPHIAELLNKNRSGLYRVAYSEAQISNFTKAIKDQEVGAVDRLGLLSDAFDTAEAGLTTSTSALNLAKSFYNEKDANVWSELSGGINSIAAIMFDTADEAESAMQTYVGKLIKHPYHDLGWKNQPNDSADTIIARETVLGLAVKFDFADARKHAEALFDETKSGTQIDPNLRDIVYNNAARRLASNDLYEWFKNRHNNEQLQEEKSRYARALSLFEGDDYAEKNITMMLSDDVRQQDVISWLARLLGNRTTRNYTWNWYQQNWNTIYDMFKDGHLLSYLALVLSPLSTFEQAEEIKNFFKDKDTTGLDMSLAQSLEKIESTAYWRQRDQQAVKNYFKQ